MLDIHTLFRVREDVVMLRREVEILTLVSFGRMSMLDREREPDCDVMERREEERVDVMSITKSLNVTLPVLAVMNEENPTSNVTVFPDSPFTLSVCVDTPIVAVSLLCVPPFNCTVDPVFALLLPFERVTQGRSLHPHVVVSVSDPPLSTYVIA